MKKRLLILGGYGGVGKRLAHLLLQHTDVEVVIGGRREERAITLAKKLNKEFTGKRASACLADVTKKDSLQEAFKNIDMVVLTVAAVHDVNKIARIALNANVDWLDIFFRWKVFHNLKKLAPEIKKLKRCFISQAGFHPGLPSVFVRRAADYVDQLETANIAMAMNAKFNTAESAYEIMDEFQEYFAEIYENKKWRRATYKDSKTFFFNNLFGKRQCMPIQMEEMKDMPKQFPLKEAGVYVSGFNRFTDNLVFPLIFGVNYIKKGALKHSLASLFIWSVNRFGSKKDGVVFLVDATGTTENQSMNIRIVAEDKDPYHFTAAPVIACINQYLDGTINKPGLHMMGHIVDTARLLKDMEEMDVAINTTVSEK